jgi:hypothetical protein
MSTATTGICAPLAALVLALLSLRLPGQAA